MFKKILIASIILSTVSNAAIAKKHSDFKNEKALAPASVSEINDATNTSTQYGVPYVGVGIGFNNAAGSNGALGNVFAGYGKTFAQKYYLGGEVFVNTASIPLSDNQNNRTSHEIGASIIPGLMLNDDIMAYGRIGVKKSYAHNTNSRSSGTQNESTNGQLGLGLQTRLTNNWDLRGEYVYTASGIAHHFTNQVDLGLVYKFL